MKRASARGEDDLARCTALLRAGSRTFSAASRLLPRRVREPTAALYAFCRTADDAVDAQGATPRAIDHLRERIARVYEGRALDGPVERAFGAAVERFALPRALPEALAEGMRWDLEGRRYRTLDDLHGYSARVAGSVGVMMTLVMGRRAPDVLARACDLGVAMQLTNIARDVGEDARRGRIYLPTEWLAEAGLDPDAFLAAPRFDARLGRVVARALAAAESLYARADAGVPALPRDCRAAIRAARLVYADIGRVIAAAGHDSVARRAVVSTPRKLWLLLRAHFGRAGKGARHLPALPSAAFLIEAGSG
jgi:15-cis-phytoene synthase